MKKTVRDYIYIIFGTILLTAGVYFFKIPNGFSTGGVSGIGTLLGKVTTVSPGTWISGINVFCLLLGFIVLGKETGIRTVFCSLLFSGLTKLLEIFFPVKEPFTDQPFLELIYAMLLTSIGSAIIFHCAASSGGTDIVALILKKYTGLNVGKALLCVDFLIAVSSFFVFGMKVGLFSVLGLFSKAYIVDGVIENMNSSKYFLVITTHPDEISEYILKELHHGATLVRATGAYTHDDKTALHTVCKRIEAIRLQKEVRRIDPSAFMIITTSSEIIGRGFRAV